MSESDSIFDEASKMRRKEVRKKAPKEEVEAKAPMSDEAFRLMTEAELTKELESDEAKYQAMKERYDEIMGEMADAYDKSPVTRQLVEEQMKHPGAFKAEVWQKLEKAREQIEQEVKAVIGDKAVKKDQQKVAKKQDAKHKKKFIGQRRNWLQMD